MPLALDQIHRAVARMVPRLHQSEVAAETAPNTCEPQDMDTESGTSLKTWQAVHEGQDTSPFHDAIHEYTLVARPASVEDICKLAGLVHSLIQLMGTCADAWKIFTLTALLRRYHQKAPEARLVASMDLNDDKKNTSVGDGERLVFYVTLLSLHRFWQDEKAKEGDLAKQAELAKEAIAILIRVSARIGGSRDVCAIIVHLTMTRLMRAEFVEFSATLEDSPPPESFANKLVPAVQSLAINNNHSNELLEMAVTLAAQQLDHDLKLIQVSSEGKGEMENDELLSTIHVTIPHNQRGSNKKGTWHRKLTNSLAEILIWQKTTVATTDARFSRALQKLKALPDQEASATSVIEQGCSLIQQMQTTIRKMRQLLNNYARQQGFSVTSSYLMDKTSLNIRMIRRAKAGDLKVLEKLARKHKDVRILGLIAKRHLDPNKALPIAEIKELADNWVDIDQDPGDDEIATLELAMQVSTVQATLNKLRSTAERLALVTCIGTELHNILCAILVAASLTDSRLMLGGEEQDVSTLQKCMDLINSVLMHARFHDTNVSAEDILSDPRWVGMSHDVIILSSRDVELDEVILKDLQVKDVTLRVHSTTKVDVDVGKVQLSLNSTIYDRIKAREPLTLGVILDCTGSMGSEIDGCKKGALKLISTFQQLAPVEKVNFMGYWDPVNVSTDPQPKSTGYLDTNQAENDKVLQDFVNTQLKCQGGGDEPEDIPQALENFIDDMKAAGLTAENGVHLLFFIADAGYRPKENARVVASLEVLKKLGVVMVMCPVRGSGSLSTMVTRAAECFQGNGQYIGLNGVGQLDAIAASVTESIRASLFQLGTVVSVTASVGSTIDVLGKLVNFQKDHEELRKVGDLAKVVPDEDEAMKEEGKVFAEKKEYSLTSRDWLYLQLSRLPPLCHESVAAGFGGKSLKELSAAAIADRLRAEDIPAAELQKAGYPEDVVSLVQSLLAGHGVKRFDD